jgi:hypothetical protein
MSPHTYGVSQEIVQVFILILYENVFFSRNSVFLHLTMRIQDFTTFSKNCLRQGFLEDNNFKKILARIRPFQNIQNTYFFNTLIF